jgi:ribonuclease G
MTEEILINFTPQETRVAVMQQGVVQELHIERTASRGLVGNVYLGRICRILPGMQSAFIEIGLDRTFLHVADIWQPRETATERPIEKILADGQSIVVQVVKDPIGTKGPGYRRRFPSPAACWFTCRRKNTSASRSASSRKPSARRCAKS